MSEIVSEVQGKNTSAPETGAEAVKLETTNAKSDFGARGWLLIIIGWLCFYMSASAVNDALNVTIPLFKSIYGWTDGELSRISSYAGWIGAILTIPAAVLMRKTSARFMLLASELVMSIAVFNWGWITDIRVYAVNFIFIQLAANTIGLLAFGAVASHWFPRRKGLVMGWATVGCNIGSCTAIWLLSSSFHLFGSNVHLYFIPFGCISLIAFVLTLIFIRDYPEECGCYPDNDQSMTPEMAKKIYEEGQKYTKTSSWTMGKVLRTKQAWLIIIGLGIYQLATMGVVSHIVPILEARGFNHAEAMMGMTFAGVIAMPFSVILGAIDNKIGTRKASMLLGAVSVVIFLIAAVPAKGTAVVAALEGGIMMGCSNNLLVSMVTSVFGRYDFDKAQGIILPIYMIVGCTGVGLFGTISDAFGINGIMISLAVLCVVSVVLLAQIPDVCIGRNELHEIRDMEKEAGTI